ncbi:MAG: hypothetical protein E7391_07790 [Ruminococcaceae bacterium]|nr:hypothetical protein [Oscillospiraceae bacterium]
MKERAFNLLKGWCDRLVEYQLTSIKDKKLYGALICPACASNHGRCADAVFPLTYMYSKTNDEKYLNCARLFVDWAENNTKHKDGGYYNDVNNGWRGITSFYQISLAETLIHFKDCLDKETYNKWFDIFKWQSEFLYDYLGGPHSPNPVINYYCGWTHSMAIAYRILKEEKYKEKAYKWLEFSLNHISEDNLLYGEGHPIDGVTKRGRRPVDIGYNVEESLPSLYSAAKILGDKKAMEKIKSVIITHLEFMLPDGAWDNSFGSRNGKWTYYGSRTSDGCQTAFLDVDDDRVKEAAIRNFKMYERCSHDGFLYGGLMYCEAGEPACLHHQVTHAKSLAHICLKYTQYNACTLARDEEYGVKKFDTVGITLVSKKKWRASICENDFSFCKRANPLGGAITMLYHMDLGPVMAASMTKYQITEPNNFQMQRNSVFDICSTMRIENEGYSNLLSSDAFVDENLMASGSLMNDLGETNGSFYVKYIFDDDVKIIVKTDVDAVFTLPVIANEKVHIVSEENIEKGENFFSLVGGFIFTPYKINLKKDKEITVEIKVK